MAKRKVAKIEADQSDYGTPERAAHGGVTVEPRVVTTGGVLAAKGARAHVECRLDWYRAHGALTDRQFLAGVRFRLLWSMAMAHPAVTAGYGQRVAGGGCEFVEARLAAKEQKDAALKYIPANTRSAVVSVCGEDERAGWYRLLMLRVGLDGLADLWRMV